MVVLSYNLSMLELQLANAFEINIHCKKLKVVLTLLWLFELQIEYTIATAGKCFRDKYRAMSNLASESHHPLVI